MKSKKKKFKKNYLIKISLSLILILAISYRCKNKNDLRIYVEPTKKLVKLNNIDYYIYKLKIVDGYKVIYNVDFNDSIKVRQLNINNIIKKDINYDSTSIDMNNSDYRIHIYSTNNDNSDSAFFTFGIKDKDTTPLFVKPFIMRP